MAKYYRGTKTVTTEQYGPNNEFQGKVIVTTEYDLDAVDDLSDVDDGYEDACDGDCDNCCTEEEHDLPILIDLNAVIENALKGNK